MGRFFLVSPCRTASATGLESLWVYIRPEALPGSLLLIKLPLIITGLPNCLRHEEVGMACRWASDPPTEGPLFA